MHQIYMYIYIIYQHKCNQMYIHMYDTQLCNYAVQNCIDRYVIMYMLCIHVYIYIYEIMYMYMIVYVYIYIYLNSILQYYITIVKYDSNNKPNNSKYHNNNNQCCSNLVCILIVIQCNILCAHTHTHTNNFRSILLPT